MTLKPIWFCSFLVVLVLTFLTGCNSNYSKGDSPVKTPAKMANKGSAVAKPPDMANAGLNYWLISEEKESQIFIIRDAVEGREAGYLVRIFNDEKKVVYEARRPKVNNYQPHIKVIDQNVVEIRQGAGTGIWYSYYFDRKNNRVSPIYESPMLAGNGKVVVPKTGKLAVADIFDKNVYYKELLIADYPPVANPVNAFQEIKWVGDNKLSVTYLAGKKGENYITKTVVFDLNE